MLRRDRRGEWDVESLLVPRKRKLSLLFFPRAWICHPFPQAAPIQMVWSQFLLAVPTPNESAAPSITSIILFPTLLAFGVPA